MQFGLYTFGDNTPDAATGLLTDPAKRMEEIVAEAVLCDRLGLDVYAVGEHHRPEYLISAPPVVLAAIAARTERIRLASAVTVLGSEDPVRVFQQFATLDLLSRGRAEIMAGRGSFIESFPLFGQDLRAYEALFEEKLALLLQLRKETVVHWNGRYRPAIAGRGVYPRPVQDPLPVWRAVGGTPDSVVRAGQAGLPLALAIIGGNPAQFAPFVKLYRDTYAASGHSEPAQVGINMHGFVAPTSAEAGDLFYPPYAAVMAAIGRERGWAGMTRQQYESLRGPEGALLVGSPKEVADKIVRLHDYFHHTRLLLQMTVGTLPEEAMRRSIELFATEVVPEVRRRLA